MKALFIAGNGVRRFIRDRSNIFFVFVFPLALVLVLGAVYGAGARPMIGLVAGGTGQLGEQLAAAIRSSPDVKVVSYDTEEDLTAAVEKGQVEAGVAIPAGYDAEVRAGSTVPVGYVSRPDTAGPQLESIVGALVAEQSARIGAARFAVANGAGGFDEALTTATGLASSLPGLTVEATTLGKEIFPSTLGRFDLGASSQLILFMFIISLTASAALIESRRLGVSTRMLSTPTSMRTVVGGEALGRLGVVLVQGIYIMLATLLLFQVDWGSPVGALAVLLAFSLVGAGAGLLMGSVFRNDQQAGGVAVLIGLGLAALGGCMAPLDIFSPTMRTVAHFTPHAWAMDAFAELVRYGGGLGDILPELGVLLGFAVVLLGLAVWRLRAALTRG